MKRSTAKRMLRKLDYLPRWAWYALAFFIGLGPVGLAITYFVFRVLEKEAEYGEDDDYAWNVDITPDGVHVRGRGASATYADDDCIVTDDEEVARQWRRTEESAGRTRGTSTQADASGADDLPDDVAAVVREGREAMQRMRRADDIIADPVLSAQIVSIEESCTQILSILEQRPQILGQLRTFLRYYLPTTLRLLDARARLENATTPRAIQVAGRISEAIAEVDRAFKKQLEALDEYRFIDLESEMDVLRDMLKADGLIEEEQDDPFVDARAARRKRMRQDEDGTPMATH